MPEQFYPDLSPNYFEDKNAVKLANDRFFICYLYKYNTLFSRQQIQNRSFSLNRNFLCIIINLVSY